LRLEIDGILKSRALPRGARTGREKRLAVQVEDHLTAYAAFEGTILEGNYGAGDVKIRDADTFAFESNNPNKVVVNMNGKKLIVRLPSSL
jgi:bifunctional non-homologous end joining protein LigD